MSILLRIVVFYVALFVLTTMLGLSQAEEQGLLELPQLESFSLSGIYNFTSDYIDVMGNMLNFSLNGVIPWYINFIIFMPFILILTYYILKMIAGIVGAFF